jgi:tripartite-type tricarboxylate transporter receptor subunit TctC
MEAALVHQFCQTIKFLAEEDCNMRTIPSLSVLAIAGSSLLMGTAHDALAQSAAEFYKGKTITCLSEFGEDAAMTVYSRVLAPFIEKNTGARVIVKPMPGAGGTLARNHLYGAKADGLTVTLISHGPKLITGGLFKLQGVRYDWKKVVPLGKVFASITGVIVGKKSAWKNPRDLAGKKFNYGESRPFYGPLMAEALGWNKMTVIPGYRSTTGRAVAISRGELQAASASAQTVAANPDLVRSLVFSNRDPGFPKVPTVREVAAPDREKWVNYIEGWGNIMYVAIAPPGTPSDRAKFLESALKKSWADPAFRKAVKKIKVTVAPEFVDAKKLKAFMKLLTALSPKDVKEMKHVITKKYKKK